MGHIAIALLIQALVARPRQNWWAGAAVASAYFIGREIAQAEYRWIETYGGDLRASMPWWGPFDVRVWPKLDQWLDWIAPATATCALAYWMDRRRSGGAKH